MPVGAQGPLPPSKIWTNKTVEIRSDLGPSVSGLVPGVNGYKVYNPGAIKAVSAQSITNNPKALLSATPYRRGYTDVWGSWQGAFQNWIFTGSHTSDSDLFEGKIWADGYIKYKSDTGWRNSCNSRLSGKRAHCNTSFSGWCCGVFAQSKHYFHTDGYIDNNMSTSDTY